MIPLATTTLTFKRPAAAEPYETPTYTTVASHVRGHISGPAGLEQVAGGSQQDLQRSFSCELTDDVDHTCIVVDDSTGLTYDVVWVEARHGLGLDRLSGSLRQVSEVPA